MKSLVLKEPGQLGVEDKPKPEKTAGETIIRVKRVGVCGSDLHCYSGDNPFVSYPRILGHECSGVVEEADESSGLNPGDKVTIDPVFNCGDCYACDIGRPNICENLKVFGIHTDGCMQEYVSVKTENVHRTNELDFETLALTEPVSIGLQATTRADLSASDSLLIIGAGPIGIATLFAAKFNKNVEDVVVLDVLDERLDLASEVGADLVVNPNKVDLEGKLTDFLSKPGAEVVIEAVGKPQTVKQSISLTAPAGTVVILGISSDNFSLTTKSFIKEEKNVIGSRLNTEQFPKAIDLLENHGEKLKPVITHKFELTELEKAFSIMEEAPARASKVMLSVE